MSEYPCTYLNKAVLKFARQDRKKSQIVSGIISAFFMHFEQQFLPECGSTAVSEQHIRALRQRNLRFSQQVCR
ncbi:hypothetical protein ACLFKR_15780 [Paraburkholderia sp. BR14264]